MSKIELDELIKLTQNLLVSARRLFHEDWEYARANITDDYSGHFGKAATFLEPNIKDEKNNWCCRSHFLESYRTLSLYLINRGVSLSDGDEFYESTELLEKI